MKNRISNLWLPGLVSLTSAMGLQMVLRRIGPHPHVVWVGRIPLLLYVPWLAVLPLFGATGAYLSRRAGGALWVCVAAGLFPAIVLFGLVCLGLAGMAFGDQLNGDRPLWLYVTVSLVNWAILPGVALLLGTLPFLRAPKEQVLTRTAER